MNEQQLSNEVALVVQQANAYQITDNTAYIGAADFLKTVKARARAVVDFFADSKQKAAAAHKAICEAEKKMLTPLEAAERALKASMGKYQAQVEEERRRAEMEARRLQQEEAERLMREAVKAEESGDAIGAEMALATAEVVADMKPAVTVEPPKAAGISTRMKWVADIVDEKAVPAYAAGICIRPVDTAALVKLAQLSSGTLEVPGIKFRQEPVISVR